MREVPVQLYPSPLGLHCAPLYQGGRCKQSPGLGCITFAPLYPYPQESNSGLASATAPLFHPMRLPPLFHHTAGNANDDGLGAGWARSLSQFLVFPRTLLPPCSLCAAGDTDDDGLGSSAVPNGTVLHSRVGAPGPHREEDIGALDPLLDSLDSDLDFVSVAEVCVCKTLGLVWEGEDMGALDPLLDSLDSDF